MRDIDEDEFDRQVGVMVDAGYPRLAGLSDRAFAEVLAPLRDRLDDHPASADVPADAARMPWLIVVSGELIPADGIVPLLHLAGGAKPGVLDRNYRGEPLDVYRPLPELCVPSGSAYLLFDVERGDEFRGVRPRDAVPVITGRGRTPLTIHEGLAFAMQSPASLERNHCYMLAGSRTSHKRVPALWISENAPKLGWCWEGNLHTWLGIASAGSRRGPGS